MRNSATVFILIAISTIANSQETETAPTFKSTEVRETMRSFGESVKLAKSSFSDALSELVAKYNADINKLKNDQAIQLESFLKSTTQAADLDEAIKIRDAIETLKKSIIELPDMQKQASILSAKVDELEKQVEQILKTKNSKNQNILVGTWRWYDGSDVVISSNGQANGNKMIGSWKSVDMNKRIFSVSWMNVSVDTLKMSDDGKLLEGTASSNGVRVWGVRIK